MMAFLLSIALFAYWGVLGFAVVTALRAQRNALQDLLLAPMVGASLVILPLAIVNRMGVPVVRFADVTAIVLAAGAAYLLWRRHPIVPWRRYAPFAAVLLFALTLAGWPLFLYGYDWLAYANNDMVTLSRAAQYFMNRGLFQLPDSDYLVAHRDYSQASWILYAVAMHRVGSELLLAWTSSVTGLRPDQAYMSFTLATHMALVSATGALVLRSRRRRAAALLSCLLVALSALSVQAVENQLCAQAGGLALLATTSALLLKSRAVASRRRILADAALFAIVLGGMVLYYPEMLPFLGLAFVIYGGVQLLRTGSWPRGLWIVPVLAGVLCVAALNTQFMASMVHLSHALQGGGGAGVETASLFPFFLKPDGLALLWGYASFSAVAQPPWPSVAIAAGALVLLLTAAAAVWQASRGEPAAIIALIMLGLAVQFFAARADFGILKLAFFAQPFMLATLAVAWCHIVVRPWVRIVPLLLVVLPGVPVLLSYTMRSADVTSASVELWKGSKLAVKKEFEHVLESVPGATLLLDAPNFILTTLQTVIGRGRDMFVVANLDARTLKVGLKEDVFAVHRLLRPAFFRQLVDVETTLEKRWSERWIFTDFALHPPPGSSAPRVDPFEMLRLPGDDTVLVGVGPLQTIFNRSHPASGKSNFNVQRLGSAANYLLFVSSTLGGMYNFGTSNAAFYQLEPDPMFDGDTMSSVGRHLLFQVLNPSERVRVALHMTATFNGDGEKKLPPASVIGATREALPLVGRGSAHVFSPPIAVQRLEGYGFVAIDMNVDGNPFPSGESGLQLLYGRDLRRDRRQLVGFARDISLVSDADYRALAAPPGVSRFPADLRNESLEYSGVYEDGWSSEDAYFVLDAGGRAPMLRVEGMVPLIADPAFVSDLAVVVDGREVARQRLALGDFKVEVPLPPGSGKRRVELRFERAQRLPAPDNRPVGGKIAFVGFR